jgi:predicted transglutaminase-like cysteine proteinase
LDDLSQMPKWQRIRDWITSNAGSSDPALAQWVSWAKSLRDEPMSSRMSQIDAKVNSAFRYAADLKVWGVSDYWENPSETIRVGATDCEGFAIFKLWLSLLAGVDRGSIDLVTGLIPSTRQMHAVLAVRSDQRVYVLDSRSSIVNTTDLLEDFIPLVAIDFKSAHLYIRRS